MKKIGLITIHSDYHYGAALQAFATVRVLKNKGYSIEIIDYLKKPTNLPKFNILTKALYYSLSYKRIKNFKKFLSPFLSNEKYHSVDEVMDKYNGKYNVILTGSDQVWNPVYSGLNELNPVFFAAFAKSEDCKKISYASSLGSHRFNKQEISMVRKWLLDYSHLSTREVFGKEQLEHILDREVKLVLDPTLLLNKAEWLKVSRAPLKKIKAKYVLVYNVGSSIEHDAKFARYIADKLECIVVFMSIKPFKKENIDLNIPHCGPAEFVWLFANADFVVTSSFHGVAFSVNLNKNFINVYNPKSPQRTHQLLSSVGLEKRTVKNIEDIDRLDLNIDYSNPISRLEEQRKYSLDYLIEAVEN